MKKFILGLLLFFSVSVMAGFHHVPHHVTHFSHHYVPRHSSHVTTKKVQTHKVNPIRKRPTLISSTFWHNGILYYIILNPRKGHVYDNKLVLCEGCHKVLVKKGVKYCSKCRRLKRFK